MQLITLSRIKRPGKYNRFLTNTLQSNVGGLPTDSLQSGNKLENLISLFRTVIQVYFVHSHNPPTSSSCRLVKAAKHTTDFDLIAA